MALEIDRSLHIIHCDLDAFYAAVEQNDDPTLRGKPVIVGGSAESRGVVSTCSYEARSFGVRSAMPITRARRLCPQGVYLPVRMQRYLEVSQQVFAILSDYTPLMEPLSIDEAILDVSGTQNLFGTPEEIGREIKSRVRSELGLTISVGISYNMFLAKLASELDKPDGMFIIPYDQAMQILRPLPVTRLWGVGDKARQTLERMGLKTIGDIQDLPPGWLAERLGTSGQLYWDLAHGNDKRQVDTNEERKSLGREITFPEDVSDMPMLQDTLAAFAAELCRKLRRDKLYCSTITLKLRYNTFKTITRSQTIAPTHADLVIAQVADDLLQKNYQGNPSLRLIGLSLGKLSAAPDVQQGDLFGEAGKYAEVDMLMDQICQRFGSRVIQRGNQLHKPGQVNRQST